MTDQVPDKLAGGQSLNGAEIAALQRKFAETLNAAINDTQLRRLALEKAVEISVAAREPVTGTALVALAEAVHAFLAAPAREAQRQV